MHFKCGDQLRKALKKKSLLYEIPHPQVYCVLYHISLCTLRRVYSLLQQEYFIDFMWQIHAFGGRLLLSMKWLFTSNNRLHKVKRHRKQNSWQFIGKICFHTSSGCMITESSNAFHSHLEKYPVHHPMTHTLFSYAFLPST